MIAAGMAEPVVDAIVARALAGQDGAEALPTVEQILGRRPAPFSQLGTKPWRPVPFRAGAKLIPTERGRVGAW
jgi:hypothetical protein